MKALTIGGAMIDTIAIIDSARIERMQMSNADASYLLLAEGHKTEALEISAHCGGGAVNSAIALARLGYDAAVLAKLGQDQRAESVMSRLMDEGVSTRWTRRDNRAETGASVLVSSHDRNAAIFTFRGANTLLETEDLREDAFAVDLVHVSSLSNRSADCFPAIVQKAKKFNAFVSTNPGIRQISSRGSVLLKCLSQIDLFALNRTEAESLVPGLVADVGEGGEPLSAAGDDGAPGLAVRGLVGGGYDLSLRTYFKALLRSGLQFALVTDGRSGAFLADAHHAYYCPTLETKVAGTAGAGDAFVATLAAFLARGDDPETSLRAASLNAASVVGHIDTQTGLLSNEALGQALRGRGHALKTWRWSL